MYRKKRLLFAMLLTSLYRVCWQTKKELNVQSTQISMMTAEDQSTYNTLDKQIEDINKENRDAHFGSNTCWRTTIYLGIFSIIFGAYDIATITHALALFYSSIGGYTWMDEKQQTIERGKKIDELKQKQEALLAQYPKSKLGA